MVASKRAVSSRHASFSYARRERPEHSGCYVTAAGTLHTFAVPVFVENKIACDEPIPSSFMHGLKLQQYIIAPAYKSFLLRTYGKEVGEKIFRKLTHFLELARIYKQDAALHEEQDDGLDLELGD